MNNERSVNSMPEPTEPYIEVISWALVRALQAIPLEVRGGLCLQINDLTTRILKNRIADELQSTSNEIVLPELRRRMESGEADVLFQELFSDRIGFKGKWLQ